MSDARTAFDLRREGRLPEALALARRLVAADGGNVWNRRALAWCLLSHGWNEVQARRANLAADWFQELTGLDLAGEAKLEASRAKLADAMQDVTTRPIVQELKTLAVLAGPRITAAAPWISWPRTPDCPGSDAPA